MLEDEFIPLKQALRGPNGLFPTVRLRDAKRVFGKIIRRKVRRGGLTYRFVRKSDLDRVRRLLAVSGDHVSNGDGAVNYSFTKADLSQEELSMIG